HAEPVSPWTGPADEARRPRVVLLPYRRIHLAWTSTCTDLKGEKAKNVDHIDCSSGVVSTRRRGLGIFALAQLGRRAEKVACRSERTATYLKACCPLRTLAGNSQYMARAQILADTFHGQWHLGIKAERWKSAVSAASLHDSRLSYLLDSANGPRGLLEPLAAGSGRVWDDSRTKNVLLVVDIGAGTTDFSLFWVVQNIGNSQRKVYQVAPYSYALGMAGDFIDERLLLQILALAHGSSDELVRKGIGGVLRLTGLRSLKERLFTTGEI